MSCICAAIYTVHCVPPPPSPEPVSGPRLSVLLHEARRIHVQWDELPVQRRRGFIRRYTVYMQPLDSSSQELNGEAFTEPRHTSVVCVFRLVAEQRCGATVCRG